MELKTFVLFCTLISSIAAFSIEQGLTQFNDSDSLSVIAQNDGCRCKNGRCVKDNRGKTKCNCKRGYALQDEFTCEECDCGSKGKCMFVGLSKSTGGFSYVKKCICDLGSAEKDGVCVDCRCGENSKCEFEDGEKVCYCIEGYAEKDGVCTRCDCGPDGECTFNNGRKICTCDEDYEDVNGYCQHKCDRFECKNGGLCQSQNGKPVCKCQDRFYGTHCEIDKCAALNCKNGGKCKITGGRAVCECPDKYEGRDCEIDKCSYLNCQNGHKCVIKDSKAVCDCNLLVVSKYTGKNCEKPTCSSHYPCQNGAECKAGTCICRPGTSGGFCDIIDQCPDLCPRRNDINCTYDVKSEKAYCDCLDKNLGYFPDTKECKRTCDQTLCKNGGNCKYEELGLSKFCRCLDGTAGDYCEDVPACRNMDCGTEASCQYDIGRRSAICKCRQNGLAFDPADRTCKKQCRDSSDCKNGGSCSGGPFNRFCRCLDGTVGDFCEEVPGCNNKNCGNDAKCVFDIDRKTASCKCFDANLAYDELGKVCKRTCKDNSQCNNGGRCLARVNNWFCHCLEGTSGDFCENVTICNVKCGNGNGVVCKYDFNQKIAECLCNDEKYEFDPVTKSCKRCDCGGKEISCNVRDGKKTCICPKGYVDENGKCKKKFCTDRKCLNGRCDVVNEQEVCSCYEGFFLEGDECKRKQCTKTPCLNGTCVVRNGGFETCVCPSGYTLRAGVCIKGKCSMHTCFGGQCRIVDGELTCVCPERYGLEGIGCFETVCKIKRCFGGKCDVKKTKGQPDEEICTCHEGYKLVNDVCKLVLCEKKHCFGGKCVIRNGEEQCDCPEGHVVVNDVCVRSDVRSF